MVKLPLRNKSVGTKVTEAEFATLEIQARARKLTLSEWVRAELLEPKQSRDDDVLLAEVLALRTIMINLLFSLAKGERLTTEAMKELIERADGDKASRAMERLSAGRKVVSKSVAELEVEARA
ncbi:hypothetical protein JAO29_09375 [Edaphobacter sp. HDX4]|uniref:hypothetical protein n=1 Tax=Edaphobacter sp. HDX4 TaxID=2794064 RepID=UPI002FE50D22